MTTTADSQDVIQTEVRGLVLNLVGYTRSLTLCARMNYETEVMDFVDSIPEGSVFYDLGACEGRFTLYAALRGVTCVAFEPEVRNMDAFTQNLKLNPEAASRITALQVALGNKTAEVTMNVGQPWAGGHQKVISEGPGRDDLNFDFTEQQTVRMETLDNAIKSYNLPAPQYLKIDIDGSERIFLEGAKETLKSSAVNALIIELSTKDKSYDAVIEMLQELGYRMGDRYPIPNEPDLFNIVFHHGAEK